MTPFTKATTNQAMRDFVQMMLCIEGTQWAKKVPMQLPVYNIAGDQDPVGNYGEGVYLVSIGFTAQVIRYRPSCMQAIAMKFIIITILRTR